VKCYKLQFLLLLFTYSFYVIASDGKVFPEGNPLIENGELYDVRIESELSDKDLESYRNKKINPVMYVMEVVKNSDGRHFKVFIMDPPKQNKPGEKKEDEPILFEPVGFDYKPVKKQVGAEYFSIDIPFEIKSESRFAKFMVLGLLVLMLLIPIVFFGNKKYRQKMKSVKRKRKLKGRAQELIELAKPAKNRRDHEKIYILKKEFKKLIDLDQTNFESYLSDINLVQYKQHWSDADLAGINSKFETLGELRVRRGI